MSLKRASVLFVLTVGTGIAGYLLFGNGEDAAGSGSPIVSVIVPETLSAPARRGREIFDANCAACHGKDAAGQNGIAPPLVHVIYEPGHHGDESFHRAVALGSPAHHWRFGDMPPVEGLSRRDVAKIITYVRELQRANGIR